MKSELQVTRALGATFARRILYVYTIIGVGVTVGSLVLIWTLAYLVSSWWWLLLVVYIPFFIVFLLGRLLFVLIARRIYAQRITRVQKKALDEFADTVQGLLEARTMGWPLFVLISVKDILLHRELHSLKKLISDTTGLQSDFTRLKKTLATKE